MSDIDFIIVNWKTPELIKITLESIEKFVKLPYEVYVVNNGDDSEIDILNDLFHESIVNLFFPFFI